MVRLQKEPPKGVTAKKLFPSLDNEEGRVLVWAEEPEAVAIISRNGHFLKKT